jgi:hypothetical protein
VWAACVVLDYLMHVPAFDEETYTEGVFFLRALKTPKELILDQQQLCGRLESLLKVILSIIELPPIP